MVSFEADRWRSRCDIMYMTYATYVLAGSPPQGRLEMSIVADYGTFTEARTHLKDVFDANARGRTVTMQREGQLSAVMPAERLRAYFFRTVTPRVRVTREDDRTIALMDDRPFVSEGADVNDALADLALSLREYAQDWEDRLERAPNHASNWALVQLIKLSTDEELLEWLERGGE